MFDPEAAFRKLDGESFTYADLKRRLEAMRAEHVGELPAEFEAEDLFKVANERKWLSEHQGKVRIHVR